MTHILAVECPSGLDSRTVRDRFKRDYPGALVQTVRAAAASNQFFLRMIAAQTLRALKTGGMLANKPEIDFLLRLGGTSQISQAIRDVGSKAGLPFVVVVAGPRPLRKKRLARVYRLIPEGPLSDSELERIEKAALLSARRT